MREGSICRVCSDTARWSIDTEVRVLYISKVPDEARPVYCQAVGGRACGWFAFSELEGEEDERNII